MQPKEKEDDRRREAARRLVDEIEKLLVVIRKLEKAHDELMAKREQKK